MKLKHILLAGAALTVMTLSSIANAEIFRTDWVKIDTIMTHETEYGGCMARVDEVEEASGGACTNWLTFSCTGDLTDEANATRLFEAAQIAYLTDRYVRFQADSSRQHNGHCFARRVDFR